MDLENYTFVPEISSFRAGRKDTRPARAVSSLLFRGQPSKYGIVRRGVIPLTLSRYGKFYMYTGNFSSGSRNTKMQIPPAPSPLAFHSAKERARARAIDVAKNSGITLNSGFLRCVNDSSLQKKRTQNAATPFLLLVVVEFSLPPSHALSLSFRESGPGVDGVHAVKGNEECDDRARNCPSFNRSFPFACERNAVIAASATYDGTLSVSLPHYLPPPAPLSSPSSHDFHVNGAALSLSLTRTQSIFIQYIERNRKRWVSLGLARRSLVASLPIQGGWKGRGGGGTTLIASDSIPPAKVDGSAPCF